jgi:hypothetical protein
MISPEFANFLLWFIVGVSIPQMLVRPSNIPEAYWVGAGVFLMLLLRLVGLNLAVRASVKAPDVCLSLIGIIEALRAKIEVRTRSCPFYSQAPIRNAHCSFKLCTLQFAKIIF